MYLENLDMVGNKEKELSLFDFQSNFVSDEDYLAYLPALKWQDGYKCKKCGYGNYCKGIKEHDRQCSRCRYLESLTAGTLFHKVKFPLVKFFCAVYFISTNKKDIASTELGRKLGIKQKVAWFFTHKVMKAMGSSGKFPLGSVV